MPISSKKSVTVKKKQQDQKTGYELFNERLQSVFKQLVVVRGEAFNEGLKKIIEEKDSKNTRKLILKTPHPDQDFLFAHFCFRKAEETTGIAATDWVCRAGLWLANVEKFLVSDKIGGVAQAFVKESGEARLLSQQWTNTLTAASLSFSPHRKMASAAAGRKRKGKTVSVLKGAFSLLCERYPKLTLSKIISPDEKLKDVLFRRDFPIRFDETDTAKKVFRYTVINTGEENSFTFHTAEKYISDAKK